MRGAPSPEQIEAHLESLGRLLLGVMERGGRFKQVGKDSEPLVTVPVGAPPVALTPVSVSAPPMPTEAVYIPDQAAAHAAPVEATGNLVQITVTAIQHQLSRNNKHLVWVWGEPGYHIHGLPAWPEVLPPDIKEAFESWPFDKKYDTPPPNMKAAIVDIKNKKVTRFV
jgi:hypothetical protein